MTYENALNTIHSLDVFGSRPGLERLQKLLHLIDNPQKDLQFIHAAGTNGKGSVCVMLSNILQGAGYKTGLYISPYIMDFRERIQINNRLIDKKTMTEAVEYIFPFVQKMADNKEIITEFELVLAVAFYCFKKEKCQIVVLETGLGGRLDATNVIEDPVCSIITPISFDHISVLGDTLKKIAFEKSGIIKNKKAAVVSKQEKEAMEEIIKICEEKENKIFFADDINLFDIQSTLKKNTFVYNNTKIELNLIGEHQIENAKTVIAAVNAVNEFSQLNISVQNIKDGLKNCYHPARLEVLSEEPLILLDGAHNPGGMIALSSFLNKHLLKNTKYKNKKNVCIIGMLADKDVKKSLGLLKDIFNTVITVNINNPRNLPAKQLAKKCKEVFDDVIQTETVQKAFDTALNISEKEDINIIICGSLYLSGEIRPYIIKKLEK